jgi:hypothetical protein
VRVVRHGTDGVKHALLLKISNPTLGAINLRLQSSAYTGEPVWENKAEHNPFLENLLVDPLTELTVNAKLMTESLHDVKATEMCQLEPAEDSFLELGKPSYEDPVEVSEWKPAPVLSNSPVNVENPSPSLRLVTQKSAVAWFELVLVENTVENEKEYYTAIPLALQIKVGAGSWENSLIQPDPSKVGEEKDMVTFDLVIAWNSSSRVSL